MKKALPFILLAGAAILLLSMRKRKKVDVSAGPTEKITEQEFFAAEPSLLDKATDVVKNVFSKTAQQRKAKQVQALAVKRAKAKGIKSSQAKAVTKALSKPAFFKGIDDDSVLC